MENLECEIAGPFVIKEASKQIAYAAVLVPGEPDSDGEILSPERVEKAAHEWLAGYRNVDLQHTLNNIAIPVESFILPMDYTVGFAGKQVVLPKGTWILASKIEDAETWNRVMIGELTGYSVMGIRRSTDFDAAGKSIEGAALKKTLLKDLGNDWVAIAVSVVDEPAVPKAKFFAFKSAEEPKFMDKVKDALGMSVKGGKVISKANLEKLKNAQGTIDEIIKAAKPVEEEKQDEEQDEKSKEEIEKSKKEKSMGNTDANIQDVVREAVKAAIAPIQEKLDAMEAEKAKIEKEAAEKAAEAAEKAKTAELEAFKAEALSKIESLEKSIKNQAIKRRGLTGADSSGKSEDITDKSDRDSFGRKRR